MRVYNLSSGNFSIQEFSDETMLVNIQCAGTSLATAVRTPIVEIPNFLKEIIIANYVDASNFGVVLPSIPDPSSGLSAEVEIYAMGPNGVNITVFLPSSHTFVDGSSSVNIPTGSGKKFMAISSGTTPFIIGTIG
jgi:hypothetical protein